MKWNATPLKRADLIFASLCALYVFWLFTVYRRQTGGMDDFDIFFKSGERLLKGENIYGPPHYYNLKYFYSVLFAGLMALLQGMELQTVKLLWFLLNTALFLRVFIILRVRILQAFPWPNALFLSLLLLCGKMVLVNYTFNQISAVVLWTMVEAWHQMEKGRAVPALLILCLGINIKIMPIALAPYMLLHYPKPFRTLLLGSGFLLLYFLLPVPFIGWEYNWFLSGEWLKTLNPVSEIHVMQTYEYGFTDISSMVTKYLSSEPVYMEPQIHIAGLSMGALFVITNLLRAALLALLLLLVFRLKIPLKGIQTSALAVAGFMALIPICFPHQREYSFMFMMPMLALLTGMVFAYGKPSDKAVFVLLVLLSSMLVWEDFTGRDVLNVFKHYRLITMGMTGLFVQYCLLVLRLRKQEMPAGS